MLKTPETKYFQNTGFLLDHSDISNRRFDIANSLCNFKDNPENAPRCSIHLTFRHLDTRDIGTDIPVIDPPTDS